MNTIVFGRGHPENGVPFFWCELKMRRFGDGSPFSLENDMNGKLFLYVDQFGNHFYARTVRELRAQIGGGGNRVFKMYADGKNGLPLHVGYVIGRYWLSMFEPVEIPVNL